MDPHLRPGGILQFRGTFVTAGHGGEFNKRRRQPRGWTSGRSTPLRDFGWRSGGDSRLPFDSFPERVVVQPQCLGSLVKPELANHLRRCHPQLLRQSRPSRMLPPPPLESPPKLLQPGRKPACSPTVHRPSSAKTCATDRQRYHTSENDSRTLAGRTPASEKQAVQLVDLDCHTHASAAEVADVPESTIWSRVRSGRKHLKELLTSTVVLLAIVGSVAADRDSVGRMNPCTFETDEDEACREDGGQYKSIRLCRRSLVEWLVRPNAPTEIKCCLALDQEHSVIRKKRALSECRPASPDPSWLQREDGRVLRLRTLHATRNRFPIPIVLWAA